MIKIVVAVVAAIVGLVVVLASAITSVVAGLLGGTTEPSESALADIPRGYLQTYQQGAGTCPGLDWSVLAAIGKVETNHGRLHAPGVHSGENSAGAAGPMQFLAPTFDAVVAEHPPPPGGSRPPSRYTPHDAIYAAAAYLCDSGARDGRDVDGAIFTYNHAGWYVRKVLDQAAAYRAAPPPAHASASWVVPTRGTCSSGFGQRDGDFHRGQDIAAPIGTPIVAASGGTVLNAGPASGYGLWVRIQHPDGIVTTYGHNNRNLVHPGDAVQPGQPIAEVGNRGESTGPHLHFQIEVHDQPTDPVAFYHLRGSDLCR